MLLSVNTLNKTRENKIVCCPTRKSTTTTGYITFFFDNLGMSGGSRPNRLTFLSLSIDVTKNRLLAMGIKYSFRLTIQIDISEFGTFQNRNVSHLFKSASIILIVTKRSISIILRKHTQFFFFS